MPAWLANRKHIFPSKAGAAVFGQHLSNPPIKKKGKIVKMIIDVLRKYGWIAKR